MSIAMEMYAMLFIYKNKLESIRWIWPNQPNVAPLFPITCSSLCNRMLWWIKSESALRSNRTNTDTSLLSEAKRRSLVTFTSAVSVLWCALNPDWNSSNRLLLCKWSQSSAATFFSKIYVSIFVMHFSENGCFLVMLCISSGCTL